MGTHSIGSIHILLIICFNFYLTMIEYHDSETDKEGLQWLWKLDNSCGQF